MLSSAKLQKNAVDDKQLSELVMNCLQEIGVSAQIDSQVVKMMMLLIKEDSDKDFLVTCLEGEFKPSIAKAAVEALASELQKLSSAKMQNISPIISVIPVQPDPIQLIVYNLNLFTTEEQLKKLFQDDSVLSIYIPSNQGQKRGFAFITMKDINKAYNASKYLNGTVMDKQQLKIQIMKNCFIHEEEEEEYNDAHNIEDIFTSDTLNEEEKTQQLNQLVLELVCYRVSRIPSVYLSTGDNSQSLLFNDIKKSGLISKILDLLKQRMVLEEKEDQSFSLITEQLLRIYLIIMYEQYINIDNLKICTTVISKNISSLIELIKNNNTVEDDKEMNKKIESLTKTLNTLSETSQYNGFNMKCLTEYLQIHEKVSPLMHINCRIEPQCLLSINTQEAQLLQLQASSYEVLRYVSQFDRQIQNYLIDQHSIFPHLTYFIVQFASSNSISQQQQQEQGEQQPLSCTQSTVLSSVEILYRIVLLSSINYRTVATAPNLFSSLVKLSKYKLYQKYDENQDKEAKEIRYYSRWILQLIHEKNDDEIQIQLSHSGYGSVLGVSVASSEYGEEGNTNEINKTLVNISVFYKELYLGRELDIRHNAPPPLQRLPQELKQSLELLEEEGLEEIEGHLTSCGQTSHGFVKENAINAKNATLNVSLHLSNVPHT
ncbi:MAG: hypothetical protein EZS28_000451 [Streblomastix strix]|uniref:RRM domain-containing protein n=1 Tax=Streblomastix strix TaxID=222440 RepID=A0A5J4XA83_9EUKA|nr:MAG: hypothetical protein EZS28_000451 [Streblomastix strix]